MLKSRTLLAAAAAATLFAGLAGQPARAEIICQGVSQVTEEGLITTPWCEDNYLARIAGYNAAAIRNNPNLKADACDAVGDDIRVADICQGLGFRGNDFFRH